MHSSKICLLLSAVTLLLVCDEVRARPKELTPLNSLKIGSGCSHNGNHESTCQKCAKYTKSPLVYPMCCNDEDEVYSWCEKYIHYGIH